MRRALLTIGGTVAGLAALLSFKTHPVGPVASAAPAAPAGPTASAASAASPPAANALAGKGQGSASGSGGAGGGTAKPGSRATPGGGATAGGGAGQASAARTVTGAAASTQYGPMQVAITVAGTKITKVTVVQQTNDGSESSQIDSMAIPKLTSEALTAQSAKIDAVSGATYTSSGYKQSLQSALDKARA